MDIIQVLEDIDAHEIPQLQVFNKIDLLDNVEPHIDRDDTGKPIRVWVSAATDQGSDLLFQALAELFSSSKVKRKCFLQHSQGWENKSPSINIQPSLVL